MDVFDISWRGRAALLLVAGLAGLAAPGPSGAQGALEACSATAEAIATATACLCPAASAAEPRSVWGTDVYSDDSSVCRAAVHSGATGAGGGGVIVVPLPGRPAYRGSARNGVETSGWASHPRSFAVLRLDPRAPTGEQIAEAVTAAAALLAPQAAAGAGVPSCPRDFQQETEALTCACPADAFEGEVWGTDIYTADSAVCRAALHAGAVTPAGGLVAVTPRGGQPAYTGTVRNGVTTQAWASFERSFTVAPGDAAPPPGASACPAAFPPGGSAFTCTCSPAQVTAAAGIWGTDVYTTDSSICRAALHAGAVTTQGGTIRVVPHEGQPAYAASERNGVTSQAWGQWDASFRVEGGK